MKNILKSYLIEYGYVNHLHYLHLQYLNDVMHRRVQGVNTYIIAAGI